MVNILGTNVNEFVANNKQALGIIAAGTAGAAVGGTLGYAAGKRSSKKRKASKRSTRSYRKKSTRKVSRRSKPKYARTAGKSKDRSTKRIRMTKTGQPYIILKSGKARFIKKSSARNSRKRKGGRY